MKSPARRVTPWIACVVAATVGSGARAEVERVATEPGSGITIELEGWAGIGTPATGRDVGLVPLEVTITNTSSASHAWTIGPDERFGRSRRTVFPTATLAVPAGGTGRATLHVEASDGATMLLAVKGPGVVGGSGFVDIAANRGPPAPAGEAAWRRLHVAQSRQVLAARGGRPADLDCVPLDMARAPIDWRGWSAFQVILMTGPEWRGLSAAARKAALDWITLGGRLVVFAEAEGEPLAGLAGEEDGGPFRVGTAVVVPWDGAEIDEADVSRHAAGRSAVGAYRFQAGGATSPAPDDDDTSAEEYGFARLVATYGPRTLPVGAILAFLAVFGIVAGPLNVMMLGGPGRRSRIFWTTPAISLAATVFLLGLMFLRDGIGGSGARRVLAILDPDSSTMAVIQEQFSRTGVLLDSTFPIREPSWMHPLFEARPDEPLVEADGAVRSGGWFRGRSDQAYLLQSVRPSRARIEFVPPRAAAGPPAVVSSVEVPLRRVFVVDDEGKYWQATDVGTGERKPLQPADATAYAEWFAGLLADAGPVRYRALDKARGGRGRRGYAYAETDRPGKLAIETLGSIRWTDDDAVVVCPATRGAAP